MQRALLRFLIATLLVGGGWIVSKQPDVSTIVRSIQGTNAPSPEQGDPALLANRDTIRVGSFNIQVFGEHKLAKPEVMNVLARVVRLYDVIAIQEVRAKANDILPHFVELINAEGAKYDFAIGPREGRTSSKEQYAFIYNTVTIDIDRESMYAVNDPDDLFQRPPFVAAFRARGPPQSEAFTFTLIDIHTEPDHAIQECDALANVIRAVREDGRHEDDVILLGDLNTDNYHLGRLGQVPSLTCAISGVPSNTRGTKLYDNIIFDSRATTEFTGRSGVFDLMHEFQLSMAEALEVSDHRPIWAEFSVREGGQDGHLASRPGRAVQPR
ncbi:MAG TPA: endonuclease/exonuclease/phosphatase family protein [Pirellulales bacterium]|jgi:endonuclease/exonuclease/phosphatase family metal-dependent hydrolase|nr:endonuclease/exonuclease/phosphatase family protein [Pirellulales bacterium]